MIAIIMPNKTKSKGKPIFRFPTPVVLVRSHAFMLSRLVAYSAFLSLVSSLENLELYLNVLFFLLLNTMRSYTFKIHSKVLKIEKN